MIIYLPKFNWFYQPDEDESKTKTNDYSGSLWTDPQKGCMNRSIFNYRVIVKRDSENQVYFKAECSVTVASIICIETLESEKAQFPVTEQGLNDLHKWLEELRAKYEKKYKKQ